MRTDILIAGQFIHLSQRATDQDSGSSQRRLAQVSRYQSVLGSVGNDVWINVCVCEEQWMCAQSAEKYLQ